MSANRQKELSLGAYVQRVLADAEAGIRRCDRYGCGEVATYERWDEARAYGHPFCWRHADEWDDMPSEGR
jgi:hypothetical protein